MKLSFLTFTVFFVAISCASKQTEQTPEQKKAEIYYGQGTTELVQKNYAQALVYLVKARELDPKDSKIRNNLGMAYYFREQYALAETELKEAIALDSKNTDSYLNLGALYMEKGRLKEARAQFEKAMQDLTFSNQYRNYYNLALLALKEGDRREAFQYLERSIKERDDYCPAYFKRGELFFEEYRFKEALLSFKEAGKGTCVNQPAPLYQQGLVLINLDRPSEAKSKFEEVIEKFPATRFRALASAQLKKMNDERRPTPKTLRTETIKESTPVETPRF